MRRKPLLFSMFLMLFTVLSCQEDTEPSNPPTTPDDPTSGENPVNYETREVQITFPEGATVDLEGAELLSFGESFEIGSDGKSKAISTPGIGHIAYLFDSDENLLLAGFINETQTEISPRTTSEVLLFYAAGFMINEEELAPAFFEGISTIEEAKTWAKEFEDLWKSNNTILSTNEFKGPLDAFMDQVSPKPNELDIRGRIQEMARVSDISVDEGDVKSGIQVFEESIGNIAINNYYRRRSHAFLYKMETKFMDGSNQVFIPNIGNGTAATDQFSVGPTSGFTTVTSTLGGAIDGSISNAGVSTTDPFKISLEENEDEHIYKVRVVGAGGVNNLINMTDEETIKMTRLSVETFVLDLFLPITMQMVGWKDNLNAAGFDVGEAGVVSFIDNMEVIINASPPTYDLIIQGKYSEAIETFFKFLATEGGGNKYMEEILKRTMNLVKDQAIKKGVTIPGASANLDSKLLSKFTTIMKVVNTIMAGQDIAQVSFAVSMSKQIEEWTIKARSAKVSLLPGKATVTSRGNQEIEAEIKNLEEEGGDNFPFFKWSTSGKYGFIQDTKGNKGESFESSDTKVTYYSQTSSSQLEEENNFEYVYVEAYYKNELIGRDTAILNLKKSSFVLKPKGLVLSGKEGSVNSAKFFIEPVRENDTDFTGKKIVWTIEGKHGQLSNSGEYSTVITTYDTNSITYECTDSETEKGLEKITARIYEKSEVDGEYFLFEELSENVEINNEGRIKIIEVAIQHYTVGPTYVGPWINCGAGTHFLIPPEENAISYTAKVIDFGPETIPSLTGYTRTWSADVEPQIDGKYEFAKWFHSSGSGMEAAPPPCGQFEAGAAGRWGTALVIIRLKD